MFFARDGWKKEGKGFNRGNQRPANCPSLLSNLISKLREKSSNFRPGSYEPVLLHFVVYIDQIGIVYVPVGKILLVSTLYIAISRQLNGKQEFRDRLERGVTTFSKKRERERKRKKWEAWKTVSIIPSLQSLALLTGGKVSAGKKFGRQSAKWAGIRRWPDLGYHANFQSQINRPT